MQPAKRPHTAHYYESVFDVDPLAITGNQPVGVIWLSPDYKHFSKAKGGKPASKKIRGLAWIALCWAATAKANKEVALLSAILEFGRRRGEVESNSCLGIGYNPIRPRQRYVLQDEIDPAVEVARSRRSVGDQRPSSAYLILALCAKKTYLTVSRPTEMRELHRQGVRPEGFEVPIGRRQAGEQQRVKLVLWSPELKAVIDEALALQRTSSVHVFGNTAGQVYTRSGWNTNWSRLMGYCEKEAQARGVSFQRFALRDMRPAAGRRDRSPGGR